MPDLERVQPLSLCRFHPLLTGLSQRPFTGERLGRGPLQKFDRFAEGVAILAEERIGGWPLRADNVSLPRMLRDALGPGATFIQDGPLHGGTKRGQGLTTLRRLGLDILELVEEIPQG